MRYSALMMCALCVPCQPSSWAQEQPSSPVLIPDNNWEAKPGQRGIVLSEETPACGSVVACQLCIKSMQARDTVGIQKLVQDKAAVLIPKGVGVLVLKSYRPAIPQRPLSGGGMSSETMMRRMQADILNSQPDPNPWPVEVRILDGDLKDQVFFFPDKSVGVLIPKPEPRGYLRVRPFHEGSEHKSFERISPKIKLDGSSATLKAKSLFRYGERMEKANEEDKAVGAYWFTMKDYPDTPAAKDAAERLKAMGFQKLPDGSYELDPRNRSKKKSR